MEPIVVNCPARNGANAVNMNSLPLNSVSEPTPFDADCALCGETFPFGYVPNPRLTAKTAGREVQGSTSDQPVSGGGSGPPASNRGPSPNDQRSNSLNPNNSANRAAGTNRSNQLNPNNAAYRASRGGRK